MYIRIKGSFELKNAYQKSSDTQLNDQVLVLEIKQLLYMHTFMLVVQWKEVNVYTSC